MTIKKLEADWYAVYYRGRSVADFTTLAAAEAYVRRQGWNPIYG